MGCLQVFQLFFGNMNFHALIASYTRMKVGGITIPCPYFSNKLKGGFVVIRGFENGKGTASDIQAELEKKLQEDSSQSQNSPTEKYIVTLARRYRIGIDCSGFVYRMLEQYIRDQLGPALFDLSRVYEGGVNRTNARTLTSAAFTFPITKTDEIRIGDMIRLIGGKHVAIVTRVSASKITYAHSSLLTKVFGVHAGTIQILDGSKPIADQKWLEKTAKNTNYRQDYFRESEGDGVFRLKLIKKYE